MTRLNRRGFLGLLAAAGAAAGVGGPLLTGLGGSSSTGVLLRSGCPLPAPYTLRLRIPPVLTPTRRDATTDYYDLVARPAELEILPGARTPIWGYNGQFPGPTISSRAGRTTVVRHVNRLPVPMVAHLHGGHTPADSDGYPTDLVLPVAAVGDAMPGMDMMPLDAQARVANGERAYTYPLRQRAATLWYHDHRMGFTGASVWRGLAGFHLHHDDEDDALPLPRGDRDLPLMIMDRSFAADGSLLYPSLDPTLMTTPGVAAPYDAGVLGDVILVNGVPWPIADVAPLRHRLRLLNACNARRMRLSLDPAPPGGGGLVQIGSDGGLLEQPIRHDAVELAPAERFDVVVDFARHRAGTLVRLVNEFGGGTDRDVMAFRVGPDAGPDDTAVPDRLSTVTTPDPNRADATRTLLFGRHHGDMGWRINGRPFAPGNVDAAPALGTTEVWRLVTDFHHPVHLHLVQFQVLSRGLAPPGPYDHGWKDVIDLRPAEEARILVPFTDHPGRFVFHCHNLEHEDMAMMGNLVTTTWPPHPQGAP